MPLSVLVVIVVVGLALVIGAVHYFGGKRTGSLSEELVENDWRQEFAEDAISDVIVSDDQKAAILILQDTGAVGLVWQMGAHHIARRLEVGSVSQVGEAEVSLDLRLNETTLPSVRLAISDDKQRGEARSILETLIAQEGTPNA